MKISFAGTSPKNCHKVITFCEGILMKPVGFSDKTTKMMPYYTIPNLLAY